MRIVLVVASCLLLVATGVASERCMTGSRLVELNSGVTVYDNSFESLCANGENSCVMFSYSQTIDNLGEKYNITGEYGECVRFDDLVEVSCDKIRPFLEPFGEVTSCSFQTCTNGEDPSACLKYETAAAPSDCSTKDGEVRAFPGCTAREAIEGIMECAAPFIYSFPFGNRGSCDDSMTTFLQCMGNMTNQCLNSNCPSMFDSLRGFRSRFSEFAFFASLANASNIEEFVHGFTRGAFNVGPVIDDFICDVDVTRVDAMIEQLRNVSQAFPLDRFVQQLFPSFNCPNIFSRLQQSGFDFLRSFYDAKDQADVANALSSAVREEVELFGSCDFSPVLDNAASVFSMFNFTISDEDFATALRVVTDFAAFVPEAPRNDSCPAESSSSSSSRYGMINLNCERYDNATGRCGRRQAWMCEFAEWRFNFMRSWMSEYYEQQSFGSADGMPAPACANDAEYVRCRESALCCYDAPRGCRVCYCKEHDYDHSYSDIMSSWRQSYRDWSRFFQHYQRNSGSGRDTECFAENN